MGKSVLGFFRRPSTLPLPRVPIRMNRSFLAVVLAQSQVLFNAYAAKLVVTTMGIQILLEGDIFKNVVAMLMILPFVLLAPTVGWLADRFSKRDVLYYSQWFQAAVTALMCYALWCHMLPLTVVCIFLLGVHTAIMAAAKLGIVKELVDSESVSAASGTIEATAMASMLLGGLAAGLGYAWLLHEAMPPVDAAFGGVGVSLVAGGLASHSPGLTEPSWGAALYCGGFLLVTAFLGVLCMAFVPRTPSHSEAAGPFRLSLLWEHFGQLRDVWPQRKVRLCILGYSYFYGVAAALSLTLLETAEHVAGHEGMSMLFGIYQVTLGLGVICGSVLVGILSGRHIELGFIPVGAIGLIGGLVAMGLTPPTTLLFYVPLFGLGFAGAMFAVPLNAYLQENTRPRERGRVMSASGLVLNLTCIVAIFVQGALSAIHIPAPLQYAGYAIPTACIALYVIWLLPENLIRFAVSLVARLYYRIRPVRVGELPEKGGVLLLCNHLTVGDAILLQLACPRNIRFVIFNPAVQGGFLSRMLKVLRCIPIVPGKAKSAVEAALEALAEGEVVCIFPEHALTRASSLQELNGLQGLLARKSGAPLLPVWLENTWNEAWRATYTPLRRFLSRVWPCTVNVYYGKPLAAGTPLADVRSALYDLGEEAFSARPELNSHLGARLIRGLRSKFFTPVVVDAFNGNKSLTGGRLLAVSLALADWMKANIPERRVGIILPPGLGATIANLACVLANKTSVNLNFTLDRDGNVSCLRRSGVTTVLSAPGLWEKLPDFPWPERRIDITTVLKGLPGMALKKWFFAGLLLPCGVLRAMAGVPKWGGREEATLLFTSGSSGEPKGVTLSHRNILANAVQIQSMLADVHVGAVLGCLPIFHSYGITVTLWWPMLGGPKVVTYVSPRETQKLIEIIAEHKIHLLITTPTFLRHYIRKARPEQLASLKLVVTGAEKLPLEVSAEFEKAVKLPVCEGYGMTEATPVVGVNLLDDPPCATRPEGVQNRQVGSVGRIMPGLSVRIRHRETDEDLPITESGILWLKGANIFDGYLDDPARTADVLKDGWYRTGDIGRMDEKGFLYIEGRVSRFSKLGGEMVPHGTIEAKIEELYGLTDHDAPNVIVVGVPDETKGESLVILTTQPLEIADVRKRLHEAGLPNLWIPRVLFHIETMPVLATGKLALAECQRIANEKVHGIGGKDAPHHVKDKAAEHGAATAAAPAEST
ncbi:hypothetical protein DB346_11270 [Verrucomicrobia bacterium LW23]|nr:hypothetical protein DB346_11270 [Verrucomicrobia bacterium LW23]